MDFTGVPFRPADIPERITVHLGLPDAPAMDLAVLFPDYIKAVTSAELYPGWPENILRACVCLYVSHALSRVRSGWYRKQGHRFDITAVRPYDPIYLPGQTLYANLCRLCDEAFCDYVQYTDGAMPRPMEISPDSGAMQRELASLGRQGLPFQEILAQYCGEGTQLIRGAPIQTPLPAYPGVPVQKGDSGESVRWMQLALCLIAYGFPSIPHPGAPDGSFGARMDRCVRRFQAFAGLRVTGAIGKAAWYRASFLAREIQEDLHLHIQESLMPRVPRVYTHELREGDSGDPVLLVQYFLALLCRYYEGLPDIRPSAVFDKETTAAVGAFQAAAGRTQTGRVGRRTYESIYRAYRGIVSAGCFPMDAAPYPGTVLRQGAQGESVRVLQEYLCGVSKLRPDVPHVDKTGQFGSQTQLSVIRYQSQAGLAADGQVDAQTWAALVKDNAVQRAALSIRLGQTIRHTLKERGAHNDL